MTLHTFVVWECFTLSSLVPLWPCGNFTLPPLRKIKNGDIPETAAPIGQNGV